LEEANEGHAIWTKTKTLVIILDDNPRAEQSQSYFFFETFFAAFFAVFFLAAIVLLQINL